jgi:hypothetical protein
MRPFRLFPALLALLAAPAAVTGQSTADQARLVFTVGLGQTSGGGELWSVMQPLLVRGGTDTLAVGRTFRHSLDVIFSGTYFPGEHLGFNVEAHLLGLGTTDRCRLAYTIGDTTASDLCSSIDGSNRTATSATLSVGAVYRLWSRQPVHPYFRANGGFVVTQQSFLRMGGRVNTPEGVADFPLFEDDKPASLQPYYALGAGVVAVIGRGYQMRFEVRDNWVRVPMITSATARQGLIPDSRLVGKHLLSFNVGFDVVLERKRGRRY